MYVCMLYMYECAVCIRVCDGISVSAEPVLLGVERLEEGGGQRPDLIHQCVQRIGGGPQAVHGPGGGGSSSRSERDRDRDRDRGAS